MPLSLTCHHAATDGWHVQTFLTALQRDFDHPEDWLQIQQKNIQPSLPPRRTEAERFGDALP